MGNLIFEFFKKIVLALFSSKPKETITTKDNKQEQPISPDPVNEQPDANARNWRESMTSEMPNKKETRY